jgi:hypothetical protein
MVAFTISRPPAADLQVIGRGNARTLLARLGSA